MIKNSTNNPEQNAGTQQPEVLGNAPEGIHPQESLTLLRLFFSFFLLGGTAFGGPAILRQMKEYTVKNKQWLHEREFKEGIALCQSLPQAQPVCKWLPTLDASPSLGFLLSKSTSAGLLKRKGIRSPYADF